jgi:hypothetical protein
MKYYGEEQIVKVVEERQRPQALWQGWYAVCVRQNY